MQGGIEPNNATELAKGRASFVAFSVSSAHADEWFNGTIDDGGLMVAPWGQTLFVVWAGNWQAYLKAMKTAKLHQAIVWAITKGNSTLRFWLAKSEMKVGSKLYTIERKIPVLWESEYRFKASLRTKADSLDGKKQG